MSKLEELCERLKELDRNYAVKSAALALEIHREREREQELLNVLANGGTYVDREALKNLRWNVKICTSESMNELPN